MDFGVVGLDGLVVGSSNTSGFGSGSGFLHKQGRSGSEDDGDVEGELRRSSKVPKTSSFCKGGIGIGMVFPQRHHHASLLRSNSPFFLSDSNQMLCFSSPKSDPNFFHSRNAGGGNYGGLNSGSMQQQEGGGFIGVRAPPFTPSQWMELEHQALIYKYITANVPVPSNLLIPIRKALESAGFLRPTAALGWVGAFNMGFSNNTDPEPGRCRRTDGKKWRCSRDAVADQKYCERHMNRGRHRSRKPVEPQPGHSNITTATATASKLISSASMPAVPANLHRGGSHPSAPAPPQINRMLVTNKGNGGIGLHDSISTSAPSVQSKHQNPFEESPRTEFGLVSSNFLLNHSQKTSSMMNYTSFNPSQGIINTPTTQEAAQSQHSLRQFFNNWPNNQSDSSSLSWSNSNPDPQSDRTQLSISIPLATSDFRSSTSSPAHEKVTLSPLRSSQELDPIQMGLGVGNATDEPNNRQANWIPILWESSMGGPLGEVLHSTNNNGGESKSSSILNLMPEGWDNNSSPSLGSSPTGVLQKMAFGSFSNSSTGSSPRTENNKAQEGGGGSSSQCSDRLGSTFVNSLPSV